jgi:hypothetical protein
LVQVRVLVPQLPQLSVVEPKHALALVESMTSAVSKMSVR